MYKGFLHTHYLAVVLFLLIYAVKTILLLSNRKDLLDVFARKTRIFEMIVSVVFLATGIYLATQLPFNSKYDYLFYIKIAMVLASIPIAIVGFRKGNKILAALSLLLITGSFGIAEAYSKRKGIARQSTERAGNTGQALFEQNCALCHGGDGKLGASGASDLSATRLDVAGITEVILRGKGMMQPVSVTDAQAAEIAAYVHTSIAHH